MTQQASTDTSTQAKTAKNDGKAKADAAAEDEGLVQLVLDRASLKFEPFTRRAKDKPQTLEYEGAPVDGFIDGVAKYTMQDDQTGEIRDCLAYLIELTSIEGVNVDGKKTPLMVFDRGSETPRPARLGESVRLNQTAILRQNLPEEVANHPTQRLKVRITPTKLDPHPTKPKLKLWGFEIGTFGIFPRPKGKVDHVALMMASAQKAHEQLAGGGG